MDAPRRLPTIRLAYVLELVATAAVCFGLVRLQLVAPGTIASPAATPRSGWLRLVGGTMLTGLSLAGGVGLAVETIRGRRPSSWGLGRWIWSVAGVYMLFYLGAQLVALAINRLVGTNPPPALGFAVAALLYRGTIYQFFGGFGWAIASVCVTAMFAGTPRDPSPDGREWAGRIFASLVVALTIAESSLRAAGR